MNPIWKTQQTGRLIRRAHLAKPIAACAALALTLVPSMSMVRGAGLHDAGPIVIGATLPMTGSLGGFGPLIKAGYQLAVDDVNGAGGLNVGGSMRLVTLHVLDDQSDPNLASMQARTLILRDNATALLGSVSPPLNIPVALVADRLTRPMVTSFTPHLAWLSGRPSGWRYAWNVFGDDVQGSDLTFQTANLVKTNRRIALFTDTEPDGLNEGQVVTRRAPAFGYTVAYHASFAVGTTNFSSQIKAAQAAGAQVLVAQMIPPDAITLWKQMKALGYRPVIAFCAKGANSDGFRQALGKLAEGAMTTDWWSASRGYPQTQRFVARYAKQLGGITTDLSTIVTAYSIARVLFDAIVSAGSTDPAAINDALARTHRTYPLGPIAFDPHHMDVLLSVMDQWQGANMVQVFPTGKGATRIEAPLPGLE